MKTIQQIRLELNQLNNEYKAGLMTYKVYKKKFSLIKNYNSTANQVKRFGAKVVKDGGGYKYIGKNFECHLFLDGCETDFWTTHYEGDNNEVYTEISDNGYSFDTKGDAVYFLFRLDQSLYNNN